MSLSSLCANNNVLILGDFNIPNLKKFIENQTYDRKFLTLNNFMILNNLSQYNDVCNINDRYLELVLATFACEVSDNEISLLPVDNYHPPLIVKFESCTSGGSSERMFDNNPANLLYNFKHCNYFVLSTKLRKTDWSQINSFSDVNEATNKFYDLFYEILVTEASLVIKKSLSNSFHPWYNKHIINDILLKNKCRLQHKNNGNEFYSQSYKSIRQEVKKKKINKQYNNYLKKVN